MEPESAYFAELAGRMQSVLGAELVGVYVGGSYALGDYDRARSDLDVAVVARGATEPSRRTAVVEAVRHEALPCPARGLELVLYPVAVAGSGTVEPGFDLNLNTGRDMAFRTDFEAVEREQHWFAIDRSVLATHGIALVGPPPSTIFRSAPHHELLPLLAETLRWYVRAGPVGRDAVLNACRSLRFAREGVWSSKPAAGQWARQQRIALEPAGEFLESVIAELARP